MSQELPARPNLEYLKKRAKSLLSDFRKGTPEAVQRFPPNARPKLAAAQHLLAREYGFESWLKLKQHVESLAIKTGDVVKQFAEAVLGGDAVRLELLFERYPEMKLRVNEPGFAFDSPAILAAAGRGNKKIVEVLLRAGADISARSRWWAGSFGILDGANPEMAAFLIERGAIVDVHSAAHLGMLEKLKELASGNPELVHARGGDGQMPLHFASTIAIAEYLLDHGADIDARDVDHESTAAQYMVRDRREIARYLVRRGCKTDILMAAALGDAELVRKHLAADPECIRTCVNEKFFPMENSKAGGTIYIWTLGKFKTAPQLAREFGHREIVELLMEGAASSADVKLINACWLGDEATAKAMVARQPNLVQTLSPVDLHQVSDAAEMNNTDAVRLMLECGWPVDGHHGATPLHWAAWHGNAEIVRIVLRHSPPLERTDPEYNAVPLGWAIHGSQYGWNCKTGDYGATVELLLRAGAKIPAEAGGSVAVRAVLREHGVS